MVILFIILFERDENSHVVQFTPLGTGLMAYWRFVMIYSNVWNVFVIFHERSLSRKKKGIYIHHLGRSRVPVPKGVNA